MPRSNSVSGLSLMQKMANIECEVLEEEAVTVTKESGSKVVLRKPTKESLIPAHVPAGDLLNSWPLLKRGRALMCGVAACAAFGALVFSILVAVWGLWDFKGILRLFLGLEGGFILFSIWRYHLLNAQPPDGHGPSTHDGWACFNKFLKTAKLRDAKGELMMDVYGYLNVWFRGADVKEIKQENVMELLCYGFWYKTRDQLKDAGLGHVPEKMLKQFEEALEVSFPPGYNPKVQFMAHLWEPVRHTYRPLAFYIFTEFTGYLADAIMLGTGFVKYQHGGFNYYTFEGNSDAAKITHKKHDSGPIRSSLRKMSVMGNPLPEAKPIVFLHGVGLGILPYVDFIYSLVCSGHPIIVVEYRHVAMRLCLSIPSCEQVGDGVLSILDEIGVQDACFVSHSYGTFVLGRILKIRPDRVFSTCFIDPVCMGMFLPQLLDTFVYRKARMNSLEKFLMDVGRMTVCKELGIAATMCRGFAWSEINVWPDDLPDGKSLVVLSGNDILVPVEDNIMMIQSQGGHHKIMYDEYQTHGEFLLRPKWKLNIANEIVSLALGDVDQSPQEAEGERKARRTTLMGSLVAMDDLQNPFVKRFEKAVGYHVRKTLSYPWMN